MYFLSTAVIATSTATSGSQCTGHTICEDFAMAFASCHMNVMSFRYAQGKTCKDA